MEKNERCIWITMCSFIFAFMLLFVLLIVVVNNPIMQYDYYSYGFCEGRAETRTAFNPIEKTFTCTEQLSPFAEHHYLIMHKWGVFE